VCNKPEKELFVANYDENGDLKWVVQPGGSTNTGENNVVRGLCSDGFNNCYVTGEFEGISIYGNTTLNAPYQTCGHGEIFVARIKDNQVLSSTDLQIDNTNLSIFPNPSSGIFTISTSGYPTDDIILKVHNILGELIFQKKDLPTANGELHQQIDLGNPPKGVYFLEIVAGTRRETKKIVIE
jgi:hypothetical protein